MTSDDCYSIGLIEREVSVDEDEDICDDFRERKGGGVQGPGVRIRVEHEDH